jgi:hypothetical protein
MILLGLVEMGLVKVMEMGMAMEMGMVLETVLGMVRAKESVSGRCSRWPSVHRAAPSALPKRLSGFSSLVTPPKSY